MAPGLARRSGCQNPGPVGTGISHCFLNNGDKEVLLLVGGETQRPGSRIHYPLNPTRKVDLKPEAWWSDVPQRVLGPHDGLPDRPATQE